MSRLPCAVCGWDYGDADCLGELFAAPAVRREPPRARAAWPGPEEPAPPVRLADRPEVLR